MTEVPDWWLGPAGIVDLVTGADERIRARGMIQLSRGPRPVTSYRERGAGSEEID